MRHLVSVNEFFKMPKVSNLLDKIKLFGQKIKHLANKMNLDEQEVKSEKDIFKLSIDKDTFKKLKSFYNQHKTEIDSSYQEVFQTSEELSFKGIFWMVLLLALTSCYKTTKKYQDVTVKVKSEYYKPASNDWTYHYGYNALRGKFEYHYGPDSQPAEYRVYLDNDDVLYSEEAYDKYKEGDDVNCKLVKVYHDGVYHHTQYEY